MGGKARIGKEIATVLQKEIDSFSTPVSYYEPFVGTANVIRYVRSSFRHASDIDPDLIAYFRALQQGWIPPNHVSKEEYYKLKELQDHISPELRFFVSVGCSFAGKKWGGYAQGDGRNFADECVRHDLAMLPDIQGVHFFQSPFNDVEKVMTNITLGMYPMVIYCDPPYQGTTKYTNQLDFDSFWKTAVDWVSLYGHSVYVSGYDFPEGLGEIVWAKQVRTTLTKETNPNNKRVEKLLRIWNLNGHRPSSIITFSRC